LLLNQLAAYAVHGDAIRLFIDGGEQAVDVSVGSAKALERPGAVLTAAPAQKSAFQAACGTRSGV
jgi:hypothetical protein